MSSIVGGDVSHKRGALFKGKAGPLFKGKAGSHVSKGRQVLMSHSHGSM